MAAVQRVVLPAPPVGDARAELRRGGEMRGGVFLPVQVGEPGEMEAEHGGSSMEFAVPVAEGRAGEEAEPELAGEGGAHEARGVVRREAEEDLLSKLVRQGRRRHGGGGGGEGFGVGKFLRRCAGWKGMGLWLVRFDQLPVVSGPQVGSETVLAGREET